MSAQEENKQEAEAGEVKPSSPTPPTAEDLDLEDLDLSIEVVEERISPSETNVFDK